MGVLLAGLIPAGWMPVTASDGKVLLVLCTEQGVQETWVDLSGDDPAPAQDHDDGDNRSCPFAALSQMAALANTGFVIPLGARLSDPWGKAPFTHFSAGFHWRYDARGPPAFS